MLNGFWHKVSCYIDLTKVVDISEYLENMKSELLVENKTSFDDCAEFFKELENDSKQRAYNRKSTINIQARSIEILLPPSIDESSLNIFSSMFMKEFLGKELLPYASWGVTKGKGRYLYILVSERVYSNEIQEIKELWASDGYRSTLTGRLCSVDEPGAIVCRKKGDVKKIYNSHFSNKSRLFTADIDAQKNSDDAVRIGFKRFIDRVRQKLVYCFVFMKVQINKSLFVPKKKHFKSMNKYQVMNVTKCNDVIRYIEIHLQDLWQILISDGKYSQDKKNQDRFLGIFFKYRRIFEKGRFTYHSDSGKKFKISFNVYNNLVKYYEAMDSLKEQFEQDLRQVRIKIIGEFSI